MLSLEEIEKAPIVEVLLVNGFASGPAISPLFLRAPLLAVLVFRAQGPQETLVFH